VELWWDGCKFTFLLLSCRQHCSVCVVVALSGGARESLMCLFATLWLTFCVWLHLVLLPLFYAFVWLAVIPCPFFRRMNDNDNKNNNNNNCNNNNNNNVATNLTCYIRYIQAALYSNIPWCKLCSDNHNYYLIIIYERFYK